MARLIQVTDDAVCIEKLTFGFVMMVLIVVIVAVGVRLASVNESKDRFSDYSNKQHLGSGHLMSQMCSDIPGKEHCGGGSPERFRSKRSKFLGTRGVGPRFNGSNVDIQRYYANAIGAEYNDSAAAAATLAENDAAAARVASDTVERMGHSKRRGLPNRRITDEQLLAASAAGLKY